MFKKKSPALENSNIDKVTRKVVTKTVETKGGVKTKTTTVSCTDPCDAFESLGIDPQKFASGGTSVTRQIVYSNSSGLKEVFEETVETYGDPESQKDPEILSGEKLLGGSKILGGKKLAAVSSPSTKGAGNFEEDCLRRHNELRSKHGVPNLTLSDEICTYAKEWADHLAATESFNHRTDNKYGENIYMCWNSDPNHETSGDEPVDSWYAEIKDYVFRGEPKTLQAGHFTQVIWKECKQMGVGWSRSKSGKILVVANYDPRGNVIGKFAANVPPPKQ